MPLEIQNNYSQVSLNDLVRLRAAGYSVLKTPHVGNQHPSNLVCAALQIPMEMVTFTQGIRDRNFHPQARIEGGVQTPLYDARIWTQFATASCGRSATEYHQSSVQNIFPATEICTDMERMQQYPGLTATVLRAANQVVGGMWYRHVTSAGQVRKKLQGRLSDQALETDVFQFSNNSSGWVTPNRMNLVFDFIYQSLSSGRDTVYHLSGPQMVQYISDPRLLNDLELMYDAVRQVVPALPLVLKVRIVPVAGARFAGLQSQASRIRAVCDLIETVTLDNINSGWSKELAAEIPSVVTPIESGTTLSQYDLSQASDLYLDPWMLNAPLVTVNDVQQKLCAVTRALVAE